jgi:two-component system, OmpR family, phosphate regulon sensor histidine kinase PhoR
MVDREPLRILLSLFCIAMIVTIILVSGSPGVALAAGGTGVLVVVMMSISGQKESVPVLSPASASVPIMTGAPDSGLIDSITDPILIVSDGRVQHANRASQAILGTHIVGQDLRLAIRHPGVAELRDDDAIELSGIGAFGHRLMLSAKSLPDGRRLLHIVDRTERLAVEQARVDFVANASHELRTPLAAILGYAETLADDQAGGDPALRARFLSIVMTEARRMQTLIDTLISLSRIEAEKHALPEEMVSLSALVAESARQWRDEQGNVRRDILISSAADLPLIRGDRDQLTQILHNLVGNALKYGEPPITLSLSSEANRVRLSVADKGQGIAPEHLPRLTERFYRVDAGRNRAVGGSGLGLSIVKHIVERHRGQLDIQSKLGAGTIVTVILPTA